METYLDCRLYAILGARWIPDLLISNKYMKMHFLVRNKKWFCCCVFSFRLLINYNYNINVENQQICWNLQNKYFNCMYSQKSWKSIPHNHNCLTKEFKLYKLPAENINLRESICKLNNQIRFLLKRTNMFESWPTGVHQCSKVPKCVHQCSKVNQKGVYRLHKGTKRIESRPIGVHQYS